MIVKSPVSQRHRKRSGYLASFEGGAWQNLLPGQKQNNSATFSSRENPAVRPTRKTNCALVTQESRIRLWSTPKDSHQDGSSVAGLLVIYTFFPLPFLRVIRETWCCHVNAHHTNCSGSTSAILWFLH